MAFAKEGKQIRRALTDWRLATGDRFYAAFLFGLLALFFVPIFLVFFDIPTPFCNLGSAPVRRPEFPPDPDGDPC